MLNDTPICKMLTGLLTGLLLGDCFLHGTGCRPPKRAVACERAAIVIQGIANRKDTFTIRNLTSVGDLIEANFNPDQVICDWSPY